MDAPILSTRRRDKTLWSLSTIFRLMFFISRLAAQGISIIIMHGKMKISLGRKELRNNCLNSFSMRNFIIRRYFKDFRHKNKRTDFPYPFVLMFFCLNN